jgi:hypothetical protein
MEPMRIASCGGSLGGAAARVGDAGCNTARIGGAGGIAGRGVRRGGRAGVFPEHASVLDMGLGDGTGGGGTASVAFAIRTGAAVLGGVSTANGVLVVPGGFDTCGVSRSP